MLCYISHQPIPDAHESQRLDIIQYADNHVGQQHSVYGHQNFHLPARQEEVLQGDAEEDTE